MARPFRPMKQKTSRRRSATQWSFARATFWADGRWLSSTMNSQYAIKDDRVYVLEVNPRASRTVPFVAKATGVPIAKIASLVMSGEKSLADFNLPDVLPVPNIFVKSLVFPFKKFA